MNKLHNEFITFGKPQFSKIEITNAIKTLKSGWAGTGLKSKEFENNFLKYKNAKYGIALNSCTSALQIALILSNVHKGDEVIVTGLTFCSTVNVIENIGAKPIFVDIHLDNLQINEDLIEKKITKKTKALILVHMHGYPSEMNKIKKVCKHFSIKLIEDCAHAIETKYFNKPSGTFGDYGCFSFYSTKNLTTIEGGMLICKRKKDQNLARLLSLHGMTKNAYKRFTNLKYMHYDVLLPGYKFNMPDLNAVIGLEQLKKIEVNYKKRQRIWNLYQKSFKNTSFIRPAEFGNKIIHGYHLYFLRIKEKNIRKRDKIMEILNSNGIGTGLHYKAILDLQYYKNKYKKFIHETPNAIFFGRSSFCIPLTPYLKKIQIKKIIDNIHKVNDMIESL